MFKKRRSIFLIVVGILVAAFFLLGDRLSSGATAQLGYIQFMGVVVGVALIVLGMLTYFFPVAQWLTYYFVKNDAIDPSARAKQLVLLGSVFAFITSILYQVPEFSSLAAWPYTDWLINYSSGFTRRGLVGELVYAVSAYVSPQAFTASIAWLILGIVALGYLRLCLRASNALNATNILAALMMPTLLLFYFKDHQAFGRKETVGYLILLLHLWIVEKFIRKRVQHASPNLNYYYIWYGMVAVFILPATFFIHEVNFFLFLPAHAMITWSLLNQCSEAGLPGNVRKLILFYTPSFITYSGIFFLGRSSNAAAKTICMQWQEIGAIAPSSCPGAMAALPLTLQQAVSASLDMSLSHFLVSAFAIILFGVTTFYFVTEIIYSIAQNTNSEQESAYSFVYRGHALAMGINYMLVPFLFSIPVYIMGTDTGRWLAVTCTNYAMISMSMELNLIEYSLYTQSDNRSRRLPLAHSQFFTTIGKTTVWYYTETVILLVLIFFMQLPHTRIADPLLLLAEPLSGLLK